MSKISILMPTYNDAENIIGTLKSLLIQTLTEWEIIIVDDGSTDATAQKIADFKKKHDKNNKIVYVLQKNSDQLNALKNALKKATGEYIFILHSDDLLPSKNTLETFAGVLDKNPGIDSVIGDFIIINDKGDITSKIKTPRYKNKASTKAKLLALFGSNFYSDVGLHRKTVFERQIKNNYLDWNTVFWIDFFTKSQNMLKVKKINQPILQYRVGATNYANSEIGRHNVLTGELRTVTQLLKHLTIPCFEISHRIFTFLARHKQLIPYFPIIYIKSETKDKAKVIDYMIRRRYKENYQDNAWLTSLVNFYIRKSSRKITPPIVKSSDVFLGSDLKKFTTELFSHNLPKVYYYLFDEMTKGFNTIEVPDEKQLTFYDSITRFLCIRQDIKIKLRKTK